jgi:TonB family protein
MRVVHLVFFMCTVALFSWTGPDARWVPARVVSIEYPLLALQSRTQGIVMVRCAIASDGTVSEAKITSGSILLGEAVLQRISEWRFRSTNASTPTDGVILTFNFVLEQPAQTTPRTKFVYDYPYNTTIISQPVLRSH